jgi:hypothetical protein
VCLQYNLCHFLQRKYNAYIYSCLCGSHLESVQDRQGEIRYQFRQCSVCLQGYGNLVTMNFFKVFEYQVGMSGMFDCHN